MAVLSAAAAMSFGQTTVLIPNPTSTSFAYEIGATLPAAQSVSVSGGSSTANYSITITNPGGQAPLWLTATPVTGKLPAKLSVRANTTGMLAGTYSGIITVTATGTSSTSVGIPVTLVVTQPLPTLTIGTTSITVTAPPLKPTATVALSTSAGPVSYTASVAGAPWITVTPASGYVRPSTATILTINIDATSLTPQQAAYTGKITIAATGVDTASKSQAINVSLTLNSSPPTITPPLWPSSSVAGAAATTVTIRGTNFYSGTTVKIGPQGSAATPTVVTPAVLDSNTMLAVIPVDLLASAQVLNLVASNPSGDSGAGTYTIVANPVIQAAVNLASYAVGAVSPGELITLFGVGIGPSSPSLMTDADQDGFVDTTVAGVTVTIDGKRAPILYLSENQISVQVPYEVTLGKNKAVAVANGNITSLGTVNTSATVPAIFTLDGSPTGQAAAINAVTANNVTTYSLNTETSPLKAGDIILLYITGEGDYASKVFPRRTGYVMPKKPLVLPQLNPLPAVTIGGVKATVLYAGPFAESIMGIMQINVLIPTSVTPGASVPVTVSVGGVPAQSGVTIAVRP